MSSTHRSQRPTSLNALLPKYSFRHSHAVWIQSGDSARVLEIARDIPLGRSKLIALLFHLRGLPSPVAGSRAFVGAMGWTELACEVPSEFIVGYVRSDTKKRVDDVSSFVRSTGRQKVAFAIRTKKISRDIVELSTETRVFCRGYWETIQFWFYWTLIRPFSGLVRSEMLRLVKEEAETEWQADASGHHVVPEVVAKLPRPILMLSRAFFFVVGRTFPVLAAKVVGTAMIRVPRRPLKTDEERFLASGQRLRLGFGAESVTGYSFGSGPTILLVHGLLGSSADFRRLIPAITSSGFRALAIDWTNHGLSPRGPILSRNSIRNLSDLITKISDLHAVIGHSAGAYFALLAIANARHGSRPQVGVFLSAPTNITMSIRATMNYMGVPRSLYCEICRWFERTLDMALNALDLAALFSQGDQCMRLRGLLFVHDPHDRYAPCSAIEEIASFDEQILLLKRPEAGHFKLLLDEAAIAAIRRVVVETY